MPISVPERGRSTVSASQLEALQASPAFWGLVERGIVSVTLSPGGGARLSAGPYVGRAVCGDEILEIVEKIPGALRSLLSYASGLAFRLEPVSGARTEIGPLIELLVSVFLAETRRYLTRGKEFRYSRKRHLSPTVAGAIRIPATAQVRARGMLHQIVFDRTVVTYETYKNIVVNRALREIERIAGTVGLDASVVTNARSLRMYFEDYASSIDKGRAELARTSERLALADAADTTLLSLAALLLRHESFDNTAWLGDSTPRTWFVNLEQLFEDALRQQINRARYAGLVARRGSTFGRSVYTPPDYARVDPDIVLLQSAEVVGVGDAKYKSWSETPARSDIYQLLVHGAAFSSPVCFLAYASDEYRPLVLGHSVTGAAVHAYALDITDLEAGVSAMLSDLDAPVMT